MKGLCVISARGGSQGLPGKNIRILLGKPLIVWSIEHALSAPEVDHVVVSTDSDRIAAVAEAAGALVPFRRPAALASSEAGKFQVWQHALRACEAHFGEEFDFYLDLDCTNPLRDVEDISRAIAQFRAARAQGFDAVFSVCESRKNPYFNMLEVENGVLRMCKSMPDTVVRRQDAPLVLDHVGSIYVLNPAFLKSRAGHLLEGRTIGYDIGRDKSFDVDSALDFDRIEFLMRRKLEAAR